MITPLLVLPGSEPRAVCLPFVAVLPVCGRPGLAHYDGSVLSFGLLAVLVTFACCVGQVLW